jgi:hypothetical protein
LAPGVVIPGLVGGFGVAEPGSLADVGRSALRAEARPAALRGAFAPGAWTLSIGRIGPRVHLRQSGPLATRRSENTTFQ